MEKGKSGSAADKTMGGSNRHFPLSTSLGHEQKGENLISIYIKKRRKERGANKENKSKRK